MKRYYLMVKHEGQSMRLAEVRPVVKAIWDVYARRGECLVAWVEEVDDGRGDGKSGEPRV